MQIITQPDFRGDGNVHNVGDLLQLSGEAMVFMLVIREISGGAGTSRLGADSVGPYNGIPLSASDSLVLQFWGRYFSLNETFIYTASNDILAVAAMV